MMMRLNSVVHKESERSVLSTVRSTPSLEEGSREKRSIATSQHPNAHIHNKIPYVPGSLPGTVRTVSLLNQFFNLTPNSVLDDLIVCSILNLFFFIR